MSNRPETNKQSCPVYKKCGGCQLQNLSYPEQLEFKQRKVEKLLKRFCTVEKIIGMKTPYHYRNKVQAAFYTDKKGKIISGQPSTATTMRSRGCSNDERKTEQVEGFYRGHHP